MDIFISWSGYRSQLMARVVKQWLESAFQNEINISLSTEISPGANWFLEIKDKLRSANIGILCLTPDNLYSHWIHYEAASIVSNPNLEPSVIPFCLDLAPDKIPYPLNQFNAVEATKEGSFQILQKIHRDMGKGELDQERTDWVPQKFLHQLDDLKQQLYSIAGRPTLEGFISKIVSFCDNSQIIDKVVNQIKTLHPGKDKGVLPVCICGSAAIGKSTFAKQLRYRINSQPFNSLSVDILPTDAYSMKREVKTKSKLQGYEPKSHKLTKLTNDYICLTVQRESVKVRPYNHFTGGFDKLTEVKSPDILIIEGVYAFHPSYETENEILRIFLEANPPKAKELKFAGDIMYRNKTVQNAFEGMQENYESYHKNIYQKYFEKTDMLISVDGYWHYYQES